MMTKNRCCLFLLVCVMRCCLGVNLDEKFHMVDLTHTINISTIYWPGSPQFNFTILKREMVDDHWYESNSFATAEHGGTHLDAPAHFSQGKWRTHEIPAERLIGPGVIINVTTKANTNPDYRLSISDLQDWESKYGPIPDGAIVLMKSGWTQKYPTKEKVLNTEAVDNFTKFHFPGFHEDAVSWLVENRNVGMVGVDTPSVDYGQSKTFPVHQLLGTNKIPGLENVGYLEAIPEKGAHIVVGVIKLFDGSGGPARIFAIYSDDTSHNTHFIVLAVIIVLVSLVIVWFYRI